jgi:hypothetical protein
MAVVTLEQLREWFETGDRPTGSNFTDLIDTTWSGSGILGGTGNNLSTITGIENQTTFDTIDTDEWRSAKYFIQASDFSGSKYCGTEITVIFDGTDIHISEFGTISTSVTDIFDITATFNSGIINMIVTPLVSPITIRYYRTGLKS